MASKPIDYLCPMREVSERLFSAYYWELDEADRYYHTNFMLSNKMVSIWNWEEGCWWYCEIVSILTAAAVEGAQRMGELGMPVF